MSQTAQTAECEPSDPGIYEPLRVAVHREVQQASGAAASRPIGLSVLTIAVGGISVALALWAAAWFGATDVAAGSSIAPVGPLVGLGFVAAALLGAVLVYGVWRLRSWAWPLGIGLTIAALALTVLGAGRDGQRDQTVSLLLEIGTLWYLLSPRVQEAFRHCR